MEYKSLDKYLKKQDSYSKFNSELGSGGGYVNFKNSGQRGSVKEFTLSLSSILSGLEDIERNLDEFKGLSQYQEKEWRDAGASFFTDTALNSMITVQTKPCFTTISKIINWANNTQDYSDDSINLSPEAISNTISKLKQVMRTFTPTDLKVSSNSGIIISVDKKISLFVYEVFKYLIATNKFGLLDNYLKVSRDGSDNYNLEYQNIKLGGIFRISKDKLSTEDLTSGPKIRFLEDPLRYKEKNYYLSTEWTIGKNSRLDLVDFKLLIESLFSEYSIKVDSKPYQLLNKVASKSSTSLILSKSFLLLAGISGTGKTRFIREQADADLSNYQLVSVRPDWHEPSDLLGYITRLTEKEQYVATDVLVLIVKAWKEVVKHGFDLEGDSAYGDTGHLQNIRPFWLCLDEMNLAPVEQYFADYLSVSETRKWSHDGNKVTYSCDPLLSSDLIKSIDTTKFKEALFLNDGEDKSERLWTHFSENGISVPFNLIVAGTVNMDETTHGFSRKVIDRALSFDFGEFFPNDFGKFFDPDTSPKGLTYPHWSHADKAALQDTYDVDGERTIAFMQAINDKLEGTPFKLAYRALNEALLSVIANQPSSEHELLAVWDDFVMCKLLPRIEGDLDKLSSNEDNQTLLQVLRGVLEEQLSDIWEDLKRPDLYREYRTEKKHPGEAPQDNSPSRIIWIPCRSKAKLDWMQARLERDTFTSFWP